MPACRPALALVGCALLATACAGRSAAPRSNVAALRAAGFVPAAPDAADAALPPRQALKRGQGDAELYLYADPLGCRCVLRGDRQAFARFQLAADEARHAADERNGARLNREARLDWEAWWPGWIW